MDENTGCLVAAGFIVVIILSSFYLYNIQPANELSISLLEDWVEMDYPISQDIADAYADDDKISNWEFKQISDRVEELQAEKEAAELEQRIKNLANPKKAI